jgi:TRAP-type C4-dicarboxylate transport system substrate-binding protein
MARNLLNPRTLTISVAAALLLSASAQAAEVTLRIDSWLSPKHVQNAHVFPEFIKQLEAATKGAVTAKVNYPPQANPRTMYDRIRTGATDIAWGLHDYTPGRFTINEVATLPASGADDAYQQSVAYWRIHKQYLEKFNEHEGVKLLTVFTHGPGLMTSRKEIRTFDDLKGMKVRVAGGLTSQVAEHLRMVPVSAPATKIYEILSAGIVDAAFTAMEGKKVFNLDEVAKYTLEYPGAMFFATFFIAMNPDKFNSLKPEYQKAIMDISGENLAKIAGKYWTESDRSVYEESKAKGINFLVASGELKEKMAKAFEPVAADWAKRARQQGLTNPEEVHAALRAEVARVKAEATKN